MKTAYVDTSCLVSVTLDQAGASTTASKLKSFELVASNLLEAELRSVVSRERVSVDLAERLAAIDWVFPDTPLTVEFETVLAAGYLRGAGLWHVAVALWLDPHRQITFLTLDDRQKAIARSLGFPT